MDRKQKEPLLRVDIRTKTDFLPGRKKLVTLRDVHLEFEAGTLTALEGGTGYAHVALGHVLTGVEYVGLDGTVLFQGEDLLDNYDKFKGQTEYAALLDNLDNLPTDMILRMAALSGVWNDAERAQMLERAEALLSLLHLKQVRDVKFRKLRPVEQKLLEFGRRIAHYPRFIYVDPQDRKLDDEDAVLFYSILHRVATVTGMCILVSPDSGVPSSIFDRLICFSDDEDGCRIAFDGTPDAFCRWYDGEDEYEEELKYSNRNELPYAEVTADFLDEVNAWVDGEQDKPSCAAIAEWWLSDCDDSQFSETERLNYILPLIKYCVDHDDLPPDIEGELRYYHGEYMDGNLTQFLDPAEKEAVIRDLEGSFHKAFPDEE